MAKSKENEQTFQKKNNTLSKNLNNFLIKMDEDNDKKPIYKKLPFWAFVGVVLFLIYQLSRF